MALVYIDPSDNSLVVEGAYEKKTAIADIGGCWDATNKVWRIVFTISNLEILLDTIPDISVDVGIQDQVKLQIEKEEKLGRLRSMSKKDELVCLRVPGLTGTLYNYQRLGVMYSVTNGTGLLLADEMGLGKSIQSLGTALFLKANHGAKRVLVVVPSSLKFNWPLEIEKFTNEKYVIINGTPDERIAQWMRDDVFFYIVNFELVIEDLFGGKKFKENPDETDEQRNRREKITSKAKQRQGVLADIRKRRWDLLIVDECFPYNTMIDTDRGIIKIGEIVEKHLSVSVLSCDFSKNESSYRRVVRWIVKPMVGQLVEVTHERGSFICTGNHRVWTEEFGYIEAHLLCGETHLRILPSRVRRSEKRKDYSEILLDNMCVSVDAFPARDGEKVCGDSCVSKDAGNSLQLSGMRSGVCGSDDKRTGKEVLLQKVCDNMEVKERRPDRPDDTNADGGCCRMQRGGESIGVCEDEDSQPRPRIQAESHRWIKKVEGDSSVFSYERGETIHNEASDDVGRITGLRMGDGIQSSRQKICRCSGQSSEILSDRHCQCGFKDCGRGRRDDSQDEKVEDHRCEEGEGFVLSRLESVKVLERPDFERLGLGSPENFRVYNLEVEADTDRDHCYVADGVLVSNCHAIKHHSSRRSRCMKELKAKFRMALTGTPMDGRLEELHSLMQFVAPGLLCSKARFFQKHIETDFWGRVTGYKKISEISQKIQPFFLRRLKKDVLKDLPDKVYENRVVSMDPAEHAIYKKLAEQGHEATEDEIAIVAAIRCKQFCNWPPMVDETCKTNSKMESFKEALDEVVLQNGHKALIFSQYKEMLNIIVAELDKMGIKYFRIDGDTPPRSRADMQKKFNEDKSIDVMIGTEAMSAGLNFQSADYVFNYDDNWSPAIMAQREDRCHRSGQRNVVTVVNFICKDTVEERIRGVIYAKNKITAQTLGDETDDLVLRRLGPKDVCRLL